MKKSEPQLCSDYSSTTMINTKSYPDVTPASLLGLRWMEIMRMNHYLTLAEEFVYIMRINHYLTLAEESGG